MGEYNTLGLLYSMDIINSSGMSRGAGLFFLFSFSLVRGLSY